MRREVCFLLCLFLVSGLISRCAPKLAAAEVFEVSTCYGKPDQTQASFFQGILRVSDKSLPIQR